MRAAIFNPYLDTLGGGERYTLSFAKVLAEFGWKVDIEWNDPGITKELEKRFALNLDGINIVQDIHRGDGYDLCFWLSDGSIPILKSRKNLLHFQVPFHEVNGNNLFNKMKLIRINSVICNSQFTKKIIDKEYGINSMVLYPPVDVDKLKAKRKTNSILFVGRFSELKQNKRQDVLVEVFKKFYDAGNREWELILAGGIEVGAVELIKKLKESIDSYPIKIVESPDFRFLKDLYAKSKFFWSASGFGVDENKHPENVEHFGITVVEAMGSGCVPLVFNAGGHKEIVKNGLNGYSWATIEELLRLTTTLMGEKKLLKKLEINAIESSKRYSYEKFKTSVEKII